MHLCRIWLLLRDERWHCPLRAPTLSEGFLFSLFQFLFSNFEFLFSIFRFLFSIFRQCRAQFPGGEVLEGPEAADQLGAC